MNLAVAATEALCRIKGSRVLRNGAELELVPRSSNYSQSEVVIFGGSLADGNDK